MMHKLNRFSTLLIAPVALMFAGPVIAQAFDGFAGQMAMSTMHNSVLNRSMNQQVNRNVATPNNAVSDGVEASVNLSYTPSKSRTRANLQNFVAITRATDPAGAAQMEQLFASTDVMGEIGTAMRGLGLSRNNVADAYAVYWINAWSAAHGDTRPTTAKMAKAVSAQASHGLAGSPEFANANDAQKQEMAEALLIQSMLIDAAFQQAQTDPGQLKALSKAISQGAAASGLDLDKMTLTADGFVPAKGR